MSFERFKVEKNKNYTTINNHCILNRSLSLKAKGMMALVMSLPDTWDFSINGITTICLEGKQSIYRVFKELSSQGYVTIQKVKNKKGHFLGVQYTFYEIPPPNFTPDKEYFSVTDLIEEETPDSDIPFSDFPYMENQPQLNTNIINEELSKSSLRSDLDSNANNGVNLKDNEVVTVTQTTIVPKVGRTDEQKEKARLRRMDRKKGIYRRNKNETLLTVDWTPPPSEVKLAKEALGLIDVDYQTKKFRDYYIAKGITQFDWVAKWRNWLRTAQEWAQEKASKTNGNKSSVLPSSLEGQLEFFGLKK